MAAARDESGEWVGRLLDGRYRVEEVLGRGGMGAIYLASDERMDRKVVVKVPHAKFLEEAGFRQRFEKEIRSLTRLEHPHVVKVLDAGDADGVPYAVLQHLAGGSLKERIAAKGGTLSPDEVSEWLPAVAQALDFIHGEGVVHRDVKPGSILFDAKGNVFLADFGISKALGAVDTGLTRTGATPGSPDYMAPEVLTGTGLGAAYDQYALGVVVYQALAGRLPHVADTPLRLLHAKASEAPSPLAPNVPAPAASSVMRALSRDPTGRFSSCAAFATAFVAPPGAPPDGPASTSMAGPTRRAGTLPHAAPTPRGRRRKPWGLVLGGMLAIAAVVLLLSGVLSMEKGEGPSWAKVSARQVAEATRLGVPVAFENSIGMRFVLVPSGTFTMGSPVGEESRSRDETPHEVVLSKAYYLSVNETTNGQYRRFKGDHDSGTKFNGDKQPVVNVSHDDAVAFIEWLNGQDRGRVYRLPTEAEWEYACRAGTTTAFWFGETISTEQANYDGDQVYGKGAKGVDRRKTTDVGSFPANGWGLYDLHGNVYEWCSDRYGDYPSGKATDPAGPSSGTSRVLRGGSWDNFPTFLRSAFRFGFDPVYGDVGMGLRAAVLVAPGG